MTLDLDLIVAWLLARDFTALYLVLVLAGCLLAVAWRAALLVDPINRDVSSWFVGFRSVGIVCFQGGLLCNALLGSHQGWGPWPSMILIAFGADVYYAGCLLGWHQRIKSYERLRAFMGPALALDARRFPR